MPHTTDVPVAWGDTDAGGLIYFPRFFHYVVVGVNAYFAPAVAAAGHLMESLRRDGYVLPAVEASASFTAPLRAGETARVEIAVTDCGETSLTVAFAVARADAGEPAASGSVTFVLVDGEFAPSPLPASIRECIRERGDAGP